MKRYACIWTGEYDDKVVVNTEDFFTEKNGYDADDMKGIGYMELGDVYIVDYKNHYVIRLKDSA